MEGLKIVSIVQDLLFSSACLTVKRKMLCKVCFFVIQRCFSSKTAIQSKYYLSPDNLSVFIGFTCSKNLVKVPVCSHFHATHSTDIRLFLKKVNLATSLFYSSRAAIFLPTKFLIKEQTVLN